MTVRTLTQLATPSEATKIAEGGVLPADAMERVKALVKQQLAKKLKLDELNIVTKDDFPNASYNFQKNELTTGLVDPDVIGHELGHAQNLQNSPTYQKLVSAAKGLLYLNENLGVPIMMAMHAFAPEDKRQDILQTLAGLSAASAGINIGEEASATANAILNSDDKLRTGAKLLPALGQHTIANIIPFLLYQLDRHV